MSDEEFIKMIKAVNEVTENQNPFGKRHAYVYCDIVTFWSVFLEIEPIMWMALGINSAILFVLTSFFLKSIIVGLVSTLVCVMIVLEVYGVMMSIAQYNVFVVTGLIACSGIAVEDVAHFIAAFRQTKGTTQQKIATAMAHTYVAIILGSLSTLISLFPLLFHYMDFVRFYQFGMFMTLVFVGLLHGTLFLPALLATWGAFTEKAETDTIAVDSKLGDNSHAEAVEVRDMITI